MSTSPTKSEDETISGAEDYDLKYAIEKARPFSDPAPKDSKGWLAYLLHGFILTQSLP